MALEVRPSIPGVSAETNRALSEVQNAVRRECQRIEESARRPKRNVTELHEANVIAKPGEVVRVLPGDEDITVYLPEPDPANAGEDIVINVEGDGTAAGRVNVEPLNGTCSVPGIVTLNGPGAYRFTSTGAATESQSGAGGGDWGGPPPITTEDLPPIPPGSMAPQADDTALINVSGAPGAPSAVALSSLVSAGTSLAWDGVNKRFEYIGSTSAINLTPTGALGVVDISLLEAGGAVTLQPTGDFSIDGFTVKGTGFWFDLVYRDTSAFRGTLNENTGAATTSIRNPGAVALAFTTQETVRLKYYNTRWRVVGVSSRPLASLFPGAPIYDVMASPFNAVADGTTDDTAAINAAIAAANAAPGVIYLGDNHRITAGLDPITSDGIIIRGRGRLQGGTVLRVDAAAAPAAVVHFDNCNYGGIEDVWIRGVGTLYTSGSAVLFENCLRGHVKRCFISQHFNGIDIFESALTDIDQVTFDDLYGEFGVRASGNGNSCHTTYITRCFGQNDLPATQAGNVTNWAAGTGYVSGNVVVSNGNLYQATTTGTSGGTAPTGFPGATTTTAHTATLSDGGVSWVFAGPLTTWYLQDSYASTFRVTDCAAVGGGYGLQVTDTLGDTPQFTRVNNLECDHNALGGVRLDGGRQAEFQQLFVTSVLNGIGVEVTANQEGDWLFDGGFMFGVPFEGFVLGADQGALSDFAVSGCGSRTANTYDAVRVDAGVEHWNISDCTIGFAHSSAAQTRYGISIATGCDNYLVIGNRLIGHDTAAILNTPGVASTRVVRSNVPDTATGIIPDGDYGDITVSASGTTWTIDNNAVTLAKLATQAADTVLANVTGSPAVPTAVTLTSLAGSSLAYDATLNRFDYNGATSNINLTPTGTVGVVDISALACGGSVTLQPSGTFNIAGFSTKGDGFWFDVIYRDTSAHVGTLNENDGATTTSIRNPGNAASTITTQEGARFRYQNSRWRLVARSTRGFALTDGDKGDITVSASGATWTIDNATVTLAKQANLAQATVIGRASGAGTGVPTALTAAQVRTIVGGSMVARTVYESGSGDHVMNAATVRAVVTVVGAGAGGGGIEGGGTGSGHAVGGGGGAGARLVLDITTNLGTHAYVVGAAGAGVAGLAGTSGDNSSFHDGTGTRTANGGGGGQPQTLGTLTAIVSGASGGARPSSGGSVVERTNGNPGEAAVRLALEGLPLGIGGNGGAGPWGGAGKALTSNDVGGTGGSAFGYGSGGGGAYSTATTTDRAGGNGFAGVIIVEEYS